MTPRNRKRAFTIVEVLVVVAIIVIIAGVVISQLSSSSVFGFVRNAVITTRTVDVHGAFTRQPPATLNRAAVLVNFTLTEIPAGTELNSDGTIPATVATTPIGNHPVRFTLSNTSTMQFANATGNVVNTNATTGIATTSIRAIPNQTSGPETITATVSFPKAGGSTVGGSEVSVQFEVNGTN